MKPALSAVAHALKSLPAPAVLIAALLCAACAEKAPEASAAAPPSGPQPSVAQWELFTHRFETLYTPVSITPQWLSDGSRFVYTDAATGDVQMFDPASGDSRVFVTAAQLAEKLKAADGSPPEVSLAGFKLENDHTVRFTSAGKPVLFDLEGGAVTPVPQDDLDREARAVPQFVRKLIFSFKAYENPSPDGKWVATEVGNDIALRSTADGSVRKITSDGAENFRWDITTLQWSPDSSKLIVAQLDWREDHFAPIVHSLTNEESIEWMHYPKNSPGIAKNEKLPIYALIDVASGEQARFDLTGQEGRSAGPLGFRPGNGELMFVSTANDGADIRWYAADARTGKLREIMSDLGGASLISYRTALSHAATALSLNSEPWASAGQILIASDRDDTLSLYAFDLDGNLVQRLTPPNAEMDSIVGLDAENGWLYVRYRQRGERAYDLHLGRVKVDGTGFTQLTTAAGTHNLVLSPSKQYVIDTHSAINRPHQVDVLRADGTLVKTLATADASRLYAAGWIDPEEFTATAADGKSILYGVIIFPPAFDRAKKYPVFDGIYNGPQTITHPNHFLTGGREMAALARQMSQLGFVSVVLDSRGTGGRGRAFHEEIYGRMGQIETPDHVAAIKELAATRPFMDLDRVGISGHSYGGYNTLRAMLTAPDFYKVGISGAPAVDHLDMMPAQASFMRYPEDNPEGYEAGSNLLAAGNLKGKLLLIHGTSDVNALLSTSLKMSDALVKAGKAFDMLIIPELDHFGGTNNETGGRLHGGSLDLADYDAAARARYLVQYLQPEGIDYQEIPLKRRSEGGETP